MKVLQQEVSYEHPWAAVSLALLLKYPNPISRHVIAGDILERYVDSEGRLVTRRILKKTGSALPSWLAPLRMFKGTSPEKAHAYIVEDTIVDPRQQEAVITSRNISHRGWMVVEEHCRYYAAEFPSITRCDCRMTVQSGPRLASWGRLLMHKAESLGMSKFKEQLQKSRLALNYILEHNSLVQRLCSRARHLLS